MSERPGCQHEKFEARVSVSNLAEAGFAADIRIACSICGLPFEFLGLPVGVKPDGATVSMDGQELRCAITPSGSGSSPIARMVGAMSQGSEVM